MFDKPETNEKVEVLAASLCKASPDILQEVVRQAELRLEHSAATALHRDQRYMMLGTAWGAFAVAGIGAFAASVTLGKFIWPLAAGSLVFSIFMLFGAIQLLVQARPRGYYTPGNTPKMWIDDIENASDLHSALADTAAIYEFCIEFNEAISKETSGAYEAVMKATVLGMTLSVLAAIVTAAFAN